jgi:ferritin-like metal-binding protein YciE
MSMRAIATLDDLFLDELSCLLEAERRLAVGRRAMLGRAAAPALRAMLAGHLAECEGQIDALKRAFEALDARPRRIKCNAAEGLVVEAEKAMKGAEGSPQVLDCAIALATARAGHYEVASYRGLIAACKEMERDDLIEILLGNLEQEEEMVARVEHAIPGLLRKAMSEVVED